MCLSLICISQALSHFPLMGMGYQGMGMGMGYPGMGMGYSGMGMGMMPYGMFHEDADGSSATGEVDSSGDSHVSQLHSDEHIERR